MPDPERKFIDQHRGGYCFEHNTLFAAALRELGFNPTILLGRVRRGPPERWVRTHMVLQVEAGGAEWLADVGFGGLGLLEPLPLAGEASAEQGGFAYTLRREGRLRVLSMRDGGSAPAAVDLYEFTDDPQTPGDVEAANHFTATHPDSIFRKTLTIQRHRSGERTILRNDSVSRYQNGGVSEQAIVRSDLPRVVHDLFDIDLPRGPFVFETEGVRSR